MGSYRYQRGETISVLLAIVGDASEQANVVGVTANLARYPLGNGTSVPFAAVPATGPTAGWYLTIAAAVSASLAPGVYVVNARLAYAGGAVEITDPLTISIDQSTT